MGMIRRDRTTTNMTLVGMGGIPWDKTCLDATNDKTLIADTSTGGARSLIDTQENGILRSIWGLSMQHMPWWGIQYGDVWNATRVVYDGFQPNVCLIYGHPDRVHIGCMGIRNQTHVHLG